MVSIYLLFQDYYTTENDQPKLDNSQDWALLHAEENEFGTILKFTRLLQTCDEHDREITVSFPINKTLRFGHMIHLTIQLILLLSLTNPPKSAFSRLIESILFV